jgi:hypothetical protein
MPSGRVRLHELSVILFRPELSAGLFQQELFFSEPVIINYREKPGRNSFQQISGIRERSRAREYEGQRENRLYAGKVLTYGN